MIEIAVATEPAMIAAAFAVRRAVFCQEQGIAEASEFDEHDATAEHMVAIEDDRIVGALRWRRYGGAGKAKIERVAVVPEARGRRVASQMLARLLARLDTLEVGESMLHAQLTAMNVYRRLGFVAEGEVFDEDGIDHMAMRRVRP